MSKAKAAPRTAIGRGRTYGLGQRDPHTLPNYSMDNESSRENREKTRKWKSLGKMARHGHSFVGMKYV